MPLALTLTLTPDRPLDLPPFLGRANYAAALALIGRRDPDLAAQIHNAEADKPLTCSGLLNVPGNRDGTRLRAGEPVFLRLTGLTPAVEDVLRAGLLDDPPPVWELDYQPIPLTAVVCDETADVWSGSLPYTELASRRLAAGAPPEPSVTLLFHSPTAFRSREMHQPIPLPELVFGSLVDRWNSFSPVAVSPEMRRFAAERIAVSRYELVSRPIHHKQGAVRVGGVGRVTYHALSHDRYWLSVFQLLADFARFSGVGVQTAAGMGQTRRL